MKGLYAVLLAILMLTGLAGQAVSDGTSCPVDVTPCPAPDAVRIFYTLTKTGDTTWRYDYTVVNKGLGSYTDPYSDPNNPTIYSGVILFDIYFPDALISQFPSPPFPVTVPDPTKWDAFADMIQFLDSSNNPYYRLAFDAYASPDYESYYPILIGQSVAGFSVSFTYTGDETLLGNQQFTVNNVWNYHPLFTGATEPNPPVANAGPDQSVQAGTVVQLDGSGSTPASNIASYQWAQPSGPQVTLSDPTVAKPTFTAPFVGPNGASLQFQLTVTDKGGHTSSATCIVNVTSSNQPPVASAGPDQTVKAGETVMLDGSGSTDPDNGIASYAWVQTGGPTVQLSDAVTAKPTFKAPEVGTGGAALTFRITVTDNGGLTATATCIVNVTWVDRPPVANAGDDQTVKAGDQVTLDGSGSTDLDDGIASYQWTQLSGPPVTLNTPAAVQCTFTAPNVPKGGKAFTFQLAVTDKGGLQSTATCTVNVQWTDTPPVVNAGNNVFMLSKDQATTVIAGTATDADGDSLTYTWSEGNTQLGSGQVGDSGQAPLSLALVPTLSIGEHTLTLAVNDGYVTRASSMLLTIENTPPTVAPTGEGTYQIKAPVTLGGRVSDYDGDVVTYTWLDGTTVLSTGSVLTVAGGTPVDLPPFTTSGLSIGAHAITLQATDGVNAPITQKITVTVIDTIVPVLAPVASQSILWPPNGKMVPITIQANATDSDGLPVVLTVTVACNESGTGFWTTPAINQTTGVISLSLQAARAGNNKDGRQYTITITATGQSGIPSTANVKIVVPHDQGKN